MKQKTLDGRELFISQVTKKRRGDDFGTNTGFNMTLVDADPDQMTLTHDY